MNKLPIIGIFIATLMCVWLFGCTKKDLNTPISNDMKIHFSYKVGTYWIYKDSITGEVDSLVVQSSVLMRWDKGEGKTYDEIGIAINAYKEATDTVARRYQWGLTDNHIAFAEQATDSAYWSAYYTYADFIRWPLIVGDSESIGRYSLYVRGNFPDMTISGVVYQNVWYLYHSTVGYDYRDLFWVNASTGILKMDLNRTGQPRIVWELLRNKIIL